MMYVILYCITPVPAYDHDIGELLVPRVRSYDFLSWMKPNEEDRRAPLSHSLGFMQVWAHL
jgi:hypothetical protein